MESRRFKGILFFLLFISLAMMDVMAFTHKAKLRKDAARRSPTRLPIMKPRPPGKDTLDGKDTVAEAKKLNDVGRKLMEREETWKWAKEEDNKDSARGSKKDHMEFQIDDSMFSDYHPPKSHPPKHP